jgi:hypothetical protein
MTQALNLGLLGNNVNTSGQVSLTAGVSGTLPLANGGIGTTTLTANNVLLGNGGSSPQVVAPGASGNLLTSNGTTWTSAAPPGISTTAGGIGTYMMARYDGATGPITFGATVSGVDLKPSNASGNNVGSAQSGTWRCMGYSLNSSVSQNLTTLWVRIS